MVASCATARLLKNGVLCEVGRATPRQKAVLENVAPLF